MWRRQGRPVSKLLLGEIGEVVRAERPGYGVSVCGVCLTSQLEFLKVLTVSARQLNIFLLIYSNDIGEKGLVDRYPRSKSLRTEVFYSYFHYCVNMSHVRVLVGREKPVLLT